MEKKQRALSKKNATLLKHNGFSRIKRIRKEDYFLKNHRKNNNLYKKIFYFFRCFSARKKRAPTSRENAEKTIKKSVLAGISIEKKD